MSGALNSAQLIKVMQLLYRRHPEIGMGIELLIEPGASSFMGSDTQKIGFCTASRRPIPFLMLVATAASVEQPSPCHLSLFSFWSRKSKNQQSNCEFERSSRPGFDLPASGRPIAPT
jgi:hypothetical protein